MKTVKAVTLVLSMSLAGLSLVGCGSHDSAAQTPTGTKVGQPLSATQAASIKQQRDAAMRQRAQGE